ncbi:hypothetical protein HDU87_000164 [Geranomyces variabilis]|uniref:Uncharacterized protein n=1 Tax=Geranomyces variabilis TaxID=109894 RepID=A0AAD5TSD3_9FUNG|nr:hypothetical protein HDU87_000164 [Geranomyces variabilis]
MNKAAARGYLEVVKWLHEHRQEGCSTIAMDLAARNGHWLTVKWLHENRPEEMSGLVISYLLVFTSGHALLLFDRVAYDPRIKAVNKAMLLTCCVTHALQMILLEYLYDADMPRNCWATITFGNVFGLVPFRFTLMYMFGNLLLTLAKKAMWAKICYAVGMLCWAASSAVLLYQCYAPDFAPDASCNQAAVTAQTTANSALFMIAVTAVAGPIIVILVNHMRDVPKSLGTSSAMRRVYITQISFLVTFLVVYLLICFVLFFITDFGSLMYCYVFQAFSDQPDAKAEAGDRALPFKLPGFVVQAIDSYLDGLKPELAPLVSREIASFENETLGSLEAKVHLVFEQIFHGDFSSFNTTSTTAPSPGATGGGYANPQQSPYATGGYGNQPASAGDNGGYKLEQPPATGGYGNQPAAVDNGGYKLDEPQQRELASRGDLGQDFQRRVTAPTDRGIISDAFNAVQTFATDASQSVSSALNPREKAEQLIPPLREKLAALLTEKHRGLSESFTESAVDQLKHYLHGNISPRELGGAGADDAVNAISSLFGGGNKENQGNGDRALPAGMGAGITNLFSQKVAQGLAVIKANLHQSLHRDLSGIETGIFNDLPDHIKGPLSMVFGGNPFAEPGDRGIVSDIGDKLKAIVKGIQEGLQEKARALIVDGHRVLESSVIDRAQDVIVGRVKKYLPNAQF